MSAVLRKVGLGLCVASILLCVVSVGSFWFTADGDSLGVGDLHDEFTENLNESLRESLPDSQTLPKTRAEMRREDAWYGLIASLIMFAIGCCLIARNRKKPLP